MRVLIFGATGATGRELVEQSLAQGLEVSAFVRDPARRGATRAGVRVVAGRLDDPDGLDAAVAGQDAVVSALGGRTAAGVRGRSSATRCGACCGTSHCPGSTARAGWTSIGRRRPSGVPGRA